MNTINDGQWTMTMNNDNNDNEPWLQWQQQGTTMYYTNYIENFIVIHW